MPQALGEELERQEGCLLPVWALFIYFYFLVEEGRR